MLDAHGGLGTQAAGGTNTAHAFRGDITLGEDAQMRADAVGGTENTGGTNHLVATHTTPGTGLVTLAAGSEMLATAGGADGANRIDACQPPTIDPGAALSPAAEVTSSCIAGASPPQLTDPENRALSCAGFGFDFPTRLHLFADGFETRDTSSWSITLP